MNDQWRYLLAMKSLPSEYRALRTLAPEVGAMVTPMIQLWDRQPSPAVEEDEDELQSEPQGPGFFDQDVLWPDVTADGIWKRLHQGLFPRTRANWPMEQPVLLDGGWLQDAASFQAVVERGRAAGMRIVPVGGLSRSGEYLRAFSSLASPQRGGGAIRLQTSDFSKGTAEVAGQLDSIVKASGGMHDSTDIVLDMRSIVHAHRERDEQNIEAMLRMLPGADRWRNVAIIASGAPARVSADQFPIDEITPYSRPEWWIWRELRSRESRLVRLPSYGDYGTLHPEQVEPIGERKTFRRIPQLRYAAADGMLMIRGHELRKDVDATAQMRQFIAQLKVYGAWAGSAFSAGDAWLEEAAFGRANPGLWGTWKWSGQVHSITHVVHQLSSPDDA